MYHICITLLIGSVFISSLAAEQTRPNVLFILVDDLRPELGIYGAEQMHTPAMDALAREGVWFERAYCQAPQCGPSRASMLTGLRPQRDRFFRQGGRAPGGIADYKGPPIVTMPAFYKENGYTAISLGKIYHHIRSDEASWSQPPWKVHPEKSDWHRIPENFHTPQGRASLKPVKRGNYTSVPWEAADVPDDAYPDGKIAGKAIQTLRELNQSEQSFFLAVGFLRPHLPLNAPQKYWDLYPPDSVKLPENMQLPEDAPRQARFTWPELRSYTGIPKKGPLSLEQAKTLKRAYRACVSYVDAQVRRLMDELEALNLAENTIVVLTGDHGWNLGEHGFWCKHSTFESSLRVPLIFRGPGVTGRGESRALADLVDLYPTLAALCQLEAPKHLEGKSLVPWLENPGLPGVNSSQSLWKWVRTIKTEEYRYSEWRDGQKSFVSHMLYNHEEDPAETVNIANQLQAEETIRQLRTTLDTTHP